MEECNSGIMDEKHINNPALFQHSNIPIIFIMYNKNENNYHQGRWISN